MRSLLLLLILATTAPAQAQSQSIFDQFTGKASSQKTLTTLAICTTVIQRNLVQIRGDGNKVTITMTKNGQVLANLRGTRAVKGSVKSANLEVQYTSMMGFANLSCNSEPAGLIQVNGKTDYLSCNSGPDARAIQICNNRWSNAR